MDAILISAAGGYLLGSIPFGYLLMRSFRGTDVRTTGSGNIGATNVARTSPRLGLLTLTLDVLKGAAAVGLALTLFPGNRTLAFIAALAAISGHIFPVWLHFRGGKGVATGLGSLVLLTPKAILLAMAVFVVVVAALRYISLASVTASAALPVFAQLLREAASFAQIVLVALGSALIILKHHQNMRRLLAGIEPKFKANRK
ncbi:MAG: acyl-phosphate glycerol 3-phosphate acyltransferase [Acidobacteria bacterium 13_1_20CM_4_56_7]|nr:MAG: acyl-phosphate glycerol 3-phosphate acyltransferase [Acidobacteria bacterium 13_1_20CM_4_56_7]